jgi:hypothetical protein
MQMAIAACLLAAAGGILSAQTGGRAIRGQQPPWPPASGKAGFTLTVRPNFQPQSLKDLSEKSLIIVDARVQQVLPARVLTHRLETDVVLSTNGVIKGPVSLGSMVVSQCGGVLGGYTEEPMQYSMMHLGERYLLFGNQEDRTSLPTVLGLPRYSIAGEWVGIVAVDGNDLVRFARASSQMLHQQYDGMALKNFVGQVAALLQQ